MDFSEWRNRYKNRNDISSRLTHLTKGDTYVKLNMIYKIKLQVKKQAMLKVHQYLNKQP